MKYLFATGFLFLSAVSLAESFGMLPIPAFKLAIPYPQGWQHNINLGMGGSFVTLDFTPNQGDKKAPSVYFMAAKTTQMTQMGMGGMGGALKGMKNIPSVPGVGGRWSGTQAAPAGASSSGEQTSQAASGAAMPTPDMPASNKSIVWLGQRVDKMDSTETLEDGLTIKTRGVSALIGDKSVMFSCSAPEELFTVAFGKLCDQIIKGMKWIH